MTEELDDELALELAIGRCSNYEALQRLETWNNFPLTTYPYYDSDFLEELATFIKNDDSEDFKRVIHALLLSFGSLEGMDMDALKTAVKNSMAFPDNKDVDKFVNEKYKYPNFEQFIKVAVDIARVDESGHVHPFLDEDNRQLYEDAVASTRNKDDKERKKDEKIARELVDPINVEESYRGVNRLRKAITEAVNIHGGKDNAITKIHAMDGTGDIIDAINYNFVATEYENLFERKLTGDCKKICGRSTLMKGLTKGQGANCFIETISMENKTEGAEKGMYIGVKKNSREFTEAEIQLAVEKCGQMRSEADSKLRKWDERSNRPQREPIVKPGEKEKTERQREMREQLQGQSATLPPPPPHPQTISQTTPQSVPPSRSPNTTNSSGILDEITRGIPSSKKGKGGFEEKATVKGMPPVAAVYDDDSTGDSDTDQEYSDDENLDEKRKAAAEKKKRKARENERKRESEELQAASSSQPPPSNYTRNEMMQMQQSPSPPHRSSSPLRRSSLNQQEEVPYGDLPSAHYVLQFDEEKETIDDLFEAELEEDLRRIRTTDQNRPATRGVGRKNTWEEEDSSEKTSLVDHPSLQREQQQQQVMPQPSTTSQSAFDRPPVPNENFSQSQQGQPMQQQQQYGQQQQGYVTPSTPHDGQQYASSLPPLPLGDPMQQIPMYPQEPFEPPPPQEYPYTGQPGASSQFDYGATFSHSQIPPHGSHPSPQYGSIPSPPPPHQLPPSTPYGGPLPSYTPDYQYPGGYYSYPPHPNYPHPPPPPHPYSPYHMHPYPPQAVYSSPYPYVVPPTPSMPSGYPPTGHPNGYGTGSGGHQSPIVNVQVVHGAPPPGSEHQDPTSSYQKTALSHGYGKSAEQYRGVPSDEHARPNSRYSSALPSHQESPYESPSMRHGQNRGGRKDKYGRDALEEAYRERQFGRSRTSPPMERDEREDGGYRRMEEERRGDRSFDYERHPSRLAEELTKRKTREVDQREFGEGRGHGRRSELEDRRDNRGVFGQSNEEMKGRRNARGFGHIEEEPRGRRDGRDGRGLEQAEEAPRARRVFGQPEEESRVRRDGRDGRGFGQSEEEPRGKDRKAEKDSQSMRLPKSSRMERDEPRRIDGAPWRKDGFGQKVPRAKERTDDEGRAEFFGQPQGDGDNLLKSHINQFNTPRRRFRWQIICILKNVRDNNRKRAMNGKDEFELIELDLLYYVVMQGCGNEMEFFEVAQELDMSGDNLFFNFLRDMQANGLCKLYKGRTKNQKTGAFEDKMYVMDPETRPPAHLRLTGFSERIEYDSE